MKYSTLYMAKSMGDMTFTPEALEFAKEDLLKKGAITVTLPNGTKQTVSLGQGDVRITDQGLELTLEVPTSLNPL